MNIILLTIGSVIAVIIGIISEFYIQIEIPGWLITLSLIAILLILYQLFKNIKIQQNIDHTLAQLEDYRRHFNELREKVSDVQNIMNEIPDQKTVASELRVLKGLINKFSQNETLTPATSSVTPVEQKQQSVNQNEPNLNQSNFPDGSNNGLVDPKVGSILSYDEKEILHFLEKAVRQDRIELFLQPTVLLPQRKRVFYECFSRITDDGGNIITPKEYLPVAEKAGLIAAVDNLLLFRCVQLVRKARRDHIDISFFCNISKETLTDIDFFTDFIDFMAENTQLASSLIFEFSYNILRDSNYVIQTSIQRLALMGFRFSLDNLNELDLDFAKLASNGFKFIKIDAHLLHELARGEDPIINMRSLKGKLDREAIDLIVEKIETEGMLLDLLDLNIDFGQGFLFGEPKPISTVSK